MAKYVFAGSDVDLDLKADVDMVADLADRVAALEAAPMPAGGVIGLNGVAKLWVGTPAEYAALVNPEDQLDTVYLVTKDPE